MATRKKTRRAKKRQNPELQRRLASRVSPDALDLRDRPYVPAIAVRPRPVYFPDLVRSVKDQGQSNACTGFALSSIVEHLLESQPPSAKLKLAPGEAQISGFMLYSMARRYDEFRGSEEKDTGSSLRGALKGWHRHGAADERLWKLKDVPDPTNDPKTDWWLDAAKRPLGAYYRLDTRAITDMHVAINEVGMIYASAACHATWDRGYGSKHAKPQDIADVWEIPNKKAEPFDMGHAFVICGYDERGFLIQNSWGLGWGSGGYAILRYEDWITNAMDCWVAQLGVATEEHEEISHSSTLRIGGDHRVRLAGSEILRNRELSPFIVNMDNNGQLSHAGAFRTFPEDVDALVTHHLAEARKKWGLRAAQKVDVAVYAHGGLVDEDGAAKTAAKWIPALYEKQIFPIFFMWETGFINTLTNLIADKIKGIPRTTGGLIDDAKDHIKRWLNQRLERALAPAGTAIWGEMKQNADAISTGASSGGVLLYQAFKKAGELGNIRVHLIGHSAGAIVHSFLIDRLAARGLTFDSVSFMAPAVRVDTFSQRVVPHLRSGTIKRYQQFHLSDVAEQADPTCRPYLRSLLYLVSESFEGGARTPILGMQRYFDDLEKTTRLGNTTATVAPTAGSQATTHGGFDDDASTMRKVLNAIANR
jgi:hypothetical protein